MFKSGCVFVILGTIMISGVCFAAAPEDSVPFPIFPEITKSGEFLCDLWFWRGEPPCFNTTTMHGAYVRYPTRQKARIIVDSYIQEGMYSREILAAFFGTLMTGTYQPEAVAPVGDFWDSGYFGLVKLDYQIEAKNILLDVVLQQGWAKGKFVEERYKALKVLSRERLITLREYDKLKTFLTEETTAESINTEWANALVTALSSFREWNEELLPLFRNVFSKAQPGTYRPVLQAFLDFNIPDDGVFILDNVVKGNISEVEDKKLCVRAAYILDDEYAAKKLKEFSQVIAKDESVSPEFVSYVDSTLARMDWFGRWQVIETQSTWDAGLKGEHISFRLSRSLEEKDDVVDFSMPMQISDPEELLPIGEDATYLTNYVSFMVDKTTLQLDKYNPHSKMTFSKVFEIKEGTGRDSGKIYLRFPLEGEFDQRGNQKYGWIEVEKVS